MFEGVERTPQKRMFAMVVPDRTAATLLSAIRRHIHPESIIYSDMWRGYVGINSRIGMTHRTVNHSRNFRDPTTGTHTNTIEGIWNGLKIGIPIRSRTESLLDDQILIRIRRRDNVDDLWEAFLKCLRETAY